MIIDIIALILSLFTTTGWLLAYHFYKKNKDKNIEIEILRFLNDIYIQNIQHLTKRFSINNN